MTERQTLDAIASLIREIKNASHGADRARVSSIPLWKLNEWVDQLYAIQNLVREMQENGHERP